MALSRVYLTPVEDSLTRNLFWADEPNDLVAQSNLKAPKPLFDIKETPESYVLEGELPGVESKNLDVEFVDKNTLRIQGSFNRSSEFDNSGKGAKPDKKAGKIWTSERVLGSFTRSFGFPEAVDTENVKANLKNGLLTVEVPKVTEKARRQKITVGGD